MSGKTDRTYGVRITREGGDFIVSVRDLPEIVTAGDTVAQALANAADAVDVITQMRMEDNEPLAPPSPIEPREYPVQPPAQTIAKAMLYGV